MKDQLPTRPDILETSIINLDDNTGPGTHWVGYAICSRCIVYFNSYGLPPPREFVKYLSKLDIPTWYTTLPTQTLTDPPICGREVLNALTAILTSYAPPYKTIHEYTMKNYLNRHM